MKSLRRGIIIVCLILLIPFIMLVFSSFPEGKYYDDQLKDLVKNGQAEVIEINKKINIDDDTIYIYRIINTETETNLRYKILEKPGWSFSASALVIYDDYGKKQHHGGGSSGKIWGEDGLAKYERINKNSKEITIKLEWYDRTGEIVVPLGKGDDE
ncbi:MAG: DUF5643 domain-containing protein [Clostridiaceae bacterium]